MTSVAVTNVTRTVLPNGLSVLIKPVTGTGAAALQGFVRAGAMLDGDRPGLARFVGAMLMRGTGRRTAQQLAEDLDAIGASLSVAAGLEITTISGRVLPEDLPALLGAAAEVLTGPSFPDEEVDKVRGRLVTAARVNALDTRYAAERLFRRLVFPSGHPHSQPPDGDETVLAALGPADLQTFHRAHFGPGAAAVTVVGEIEAGRTLDLVHAAFSDWPTGRASTPPQFAPPAAAGGVRREEVRLAGKTQADLVLGGLGIARLDPAYYAMMMGNLVLGQLGMMGRIGENVRERLGMAYYAYSDLRAGLLAGPWWVRAGVNPVNIDRAIGAILTEVRNLQRDGPQDDELADARRFLVGSLAVRLETSQGIAQALADIELYGLGLDYLERYPSIIESVQRDDIVAAIRRFPADAHTLAIAGPARP